jgi:hypothetical protein
VLIVDRPREIEAEGHSLCGERLLPRQEGYLVTRVAPGASEGTESGPSRFSSTRNTDEDLQYVIVVWNRIPSHVKAGIVAMVQAVMKEESAT